jgi:hypothetical protein
MMRFGLSVLLLALFAACRSDGDAPSTAACVADAEMDVYSTKDGVVHTDHPSYAGPLGNPPKYTADPPSGGDHLSPSVGAGVYRGDNVPPDGVLVHSLEHGYVILWFQGDEDFDVVEDAAREHPRDTIVVQRPSMDVPVAATAWGRRLLCESVDPATLAEFVEERRNQAPEKVPH